MLIVPRIKQRHAVRPQPSELGVSLLLVAKSLDELFDGDVGLVSESVALGGDAGGLDEGVGVCGDSGDGAGDVAGKARGR